MGSKNHVDFSRPQSSTGVGSVDQVDIVSVVGHVLGDESWA